MGTIRYVLRVDKPLKSGKAPLDLLYQVSGQRKYFRTELKFFSPLWDTDKQKPLYLDKKQAKKNLPQIDYNLLPTFQDVQESEATMQTLNSLISDIEKRFKMDKISFSSQMVIDRLKAEAKGVTKKEAKSNEVFEFMDKYLLDHASSREARSLSVYKSVRNHLFNYCKTSGKKVTFDNIDYNFFLSFQIFLQQDQTLTKTIKGEIKEVVVKGLNNTTVAKQLSTVKTFLNYARKQGIEVSMKFKDFKIKRENLEVIALTSEEFETLYTMDLSGNKRLSQIRDVFCFACTTGLRYSDLAQLKREHIKNDEIKLTVTKTKELLTIPLNSYSRSLLAKYEGLHRPLPVISNQNMNYAVKDLCKLAGIDEQVEIVRFRGVKREAITYPKYELIGVHTGRKTFATLSLEKGMSAEEVMSCTGHRCYKSFSRYVKVTEQRKKVVMVKAWDSAKGENLLKAV